MKLGEIEAYKRDVDEEKRWKMLLVDWNCCWRRRSGRLGLVLVLSWRRKGAAVIFGADLNCCVIRLKRRGFERTQG